MTVGLLQVQSKSNFVAPVAGDYDLSRQIILFLLCIVWFFPGTIDRGLWKPVETNLVPIAYESFNDGWSPKLTQLGEDYAYEAPLYLYLAASFSKLLDSQLSFHSGMRMLNILWLGLGFFLVGYLLTRRHGNRVGWRAVLLMMGSLGLLLHARTVNPDITLIFISASGLLAIYLLRLKPLHGGLLLGITAAIGFLTVGLLAIWYCALLVIFPLLFKFKAIVNKFNTGHFLAILICFIVVAAWHQSLSTSPKYLDDYFQNQFNAFNIVNLVTNMQTNFLAALWITWPSLPFAAMAYIRWQYHKDDQDEIPLGLIGTLAGFVSLILAGNERESAVIILLAPVAVMATVSIHGLSKEIAKMLDWFAVIVIGGGMIGFFWIAWIALNFGAPASIITWLNSQGINSSTSDLSVLFAIFSSLAWLGMMIRIGRSPDRAVLNWMVGITMAWLVFSILWMKPLDKSKSYEPIATSLQATITNPADCIVFADINHETVNQLAYLSKLNFQFAHNTNNCKYKMLPSQNHPQLDYIWLGNRISDSQKDEIGIVLQ